MSVAIRAQGTRRSRLWEVPEQYLCAIVGTCVPVGELRRLARRAGFEDADGASDYELHHAAVNYARERNPLSELLHKALETRYAPVVRAFSRAATPDEVRTHWRAALERGEAAGALWAVMSHGAATPEVWDDASHDIHMLSHQVGASSRADLRRLRELERTEAEQRAVIERQRAGFESKVRERDAAIAELEHRAADLAGRLRVAEARAQDARCSCGCAAAAAGAQRAADLADERGRELAQARARCLELERELDAMRRERDAAERALAQLREAPCDTPCGLPCGDLAGRRVLCVGGRPGCVEQYRSLVERWRGGFVHHDGGLEHSAKRLHSLLGSADAVICAASQVSHGAYYVVKRYCKLYGKPCVLLKNASVGSFMTGLETIATQ